MRVSPSRRCFRLRGHAGFTMLEVLLALALIALFASILIGGSIRMLTTEPATATDVFWKAVQEARKRALKAEHEIRLRFDAEKKQFVLINGAAPTLVSADGATKEEATLQTFPVPRATQDLVVEFLSASKGGNRILVGGVVLETNQVKYVTFYPDGTCTPFRVQLRRDSGASVLAVDPWTCAPMLAPADPNALPF